MILIVQKSQLNFYRNHGKASLHTALGKPHHDSAHAHCPGSRRIHVDLMIEVRSRDQRHPRRAAAYVRRASVGFTACAAASSVAAAGGALRSSLVGQSPQQRCSLVRHRAQLGGAGGCCERRPAATDAAVAVTATQLRRPTRLLW